MRVRLLSVLTFAWIAAMPVPATAQLAIEATQARDSIPATIAELISNPQAFAGKRVRLMGQLDECSGWECSLCPEAMTIRTRDAKQCLALEFRPLMPGTGFGAHEQEAIFRFSSVVLTATFDPRCWGEIRCLDRQVVLDEAVVVSVTRRRAARLGLWLGEQEAMVEIAGEPSNVLRTAAHDAGFPSTTPFKAFRVESSPGLAIVCWTQIESDPGSWPVTAEAALFAKGTSDFYHCNAVRNIAGRWVVQIAGSY